MIDIPHSSVKSLSAQEFSATWKSYAELVQARLLFFSEINTMILKGKGDRAIFETVMREATRLAGADRFFILLRDVSGEYSFIGYDKDSDSVLGLEDLNPLEKGEFFKSAGELLTTGVGRLSEHSAREPSGDSPTAISALSPIVVDEQALGVICLQRIAPSEGFHSDDCVYLDALATQLSLHIQRGQLHEAIAANRRRAAAGVSKKALDRAGGLEKLKIIGSSYGIRSVLEKIELIANTKISVWICGESGTGKELFARALHLRSDRCQGPYISENCGAIPENILESELFGHKRGAFTNAHSDRVGLIEQADQGTLFLDEIADMSLQMQAKLLRVLQEGEIRPVGSGKKVKVNFRLVTASNIDLAELVREGRFRQDLFFRINGMVLRLPPLRERREDIPLLVEHFSKIFAGEYGLEKIEVLPETMELLMEHAWPGNVRELQSALRNAILFSKGKSIEPSHLNLQLFPKSNLAPIEFYEGRRSIDEGALERRLLLQALAETSGDKKAAAKKMGITLRNLYTKLENFGIPKKKAVLLRYLSESKFY